MMTTQKFHVNSMLNKQRQKDGKLQIFIRIYLDGKRTEIYTKHYVALKDWDSTNNSVKTTDPNSYLINTSIDEIKTKLNKQHVKLVVLEEEITLSKLKNHFLGKTDKETPTHKTIMEAFDYHNLKMAETAKVGKVSEKTLMRYKITQNKVKSYMKEKFKVEDKPL
jgi:hypothetical protein